MPMISVVIRTLNEGRHLEELLHSINSQQLADDLQLETVVIDSGSTDRTLEITERHQCRITHISKADFTFGRSLNMGSAFARGDYLVYVSGHCVPVDEFWLTRLVAPLMKGISPYAYGRQIGRDTTKYSERQLFQKYFPERSRIPQDDIFCNNANSALLRSTWQEYRFDEEILGLEDMELSRRLTDAGEQIAYVADAAVYHIHDETWTQTKRRYEREAIALQTIMPEVHVSIFNILHYICASIFSDGVLAFREGCLWKELGGIVKFRLAQYWGAYRGNHEHRKLSQKRKYNYFYPNKVMGD